MIGREHLPASQEAISSLKRTKVIHLMRHGVTHMNVYLSQHHFGSPGFRDPLIYDTRLTPEGLDGARVAAIVTSQLTPPPQVLVVSPLTRALQTAQLAFPDFHGPVLVEALARERVWLSSDCGRSPEVLKKEFPDGRYRFDHLPEIWWYNGNSSNPKTIKEEPLDVFKLRVQELKKSLLSRPESCIALVAHWGVLMELTRREFENCEVMSYTLREDGVMNPDW